MRKNGRNERPENGADAKPCLSNVYKKSTQARRRRADVPFSGRSMVEMLGVLAIIGVLSVGAISGYSKAMMKYKLNQFSESLNQLLNNITQLLSSLDHTGGNINVSLLDKLSLIPDGFSVENTALLDIFHNTVTFGSFPHNSLGRETYLFFSLERTGNKVGNAAITWCLNIINAAKEHHGDLFALQVRQYGETGSAQDYTATSLYGDPYCGKFRQCLNTVSLDKLYTFCSQCESSTGCLLGIFWAQKNPYSL